MRLLILIILIVSSIWGWKFWSKSFRNSLKYESELSRLLKSHVITLSHQIGDRNVFSIDALNQSADYITKTFNSIGYKTEFQYYTCRGAKIKNIIATKIGVSNPSFIIIVGAHYDTCFNVGADDNASAVAALLELSRFMFNKKTDKTLKFIAFVNEEPPFFKSDNMGSMVYAKKAKEKNEDIKAAIILEMLGFYNEKPFSQRYPPLFGFFFPSKANFIAAIGNFKSQWLVKMVVKSFKKATSFPIEYLTTFSFVPGVDFSDNWSFWKMGYPAIMITDTAFYRNPHYHTNSDTYETLNYEYMAEIVKGIAESLIDLTSDAPPL
ncbi:MAG: M28 family peptidase [Candidatus Hydrogenedentota bacterium]